MHLLLNKLFPNKFSFYLLLLILFHIILNFIFSVINIAPPIWDSAGHLVLSFIFMDNLLLFFGNQVTTYTLLTISAYYPPLIHIVGALIMLIIGRNYEIPLYFIGTGFFVLSIIFLYKIVLLKFPNNYKLAFLCSTIYSLFPQVWDQSRHFHLDIPLTAFLLITFYFLLKSKVFESRFYMFLFFLFFAFVQLTKWYGFIYLIGPILLEIGPKFKNIKSKINILLGIFLFSGLVFPWYLINFQSIISTTSLTATQDADDPTVLFSLYNYVHYFRMMMSHQIGFISILLLPLSFIFIWLKNKRLALYSILLFFLPYLIFTFIQNKDLRYIMPLTPLIAFIIAYLFCKLRSLFTGIYILYLIVLYFFFSFNHFTSLTGLYQAFGILMGGPYGYYWNKYPQFYALNSYEWLGEDILQNIARIASQESSLVGSYKVLEISDNRFYSLASFDMYKLQNKFYDMEFKVPYNYTGVLSPTEFEEYLSDIAFAIIPLDPGPPGLRNIQVLRQLQGYFLSSDNTLFERVEEYKMPDGNSLFLYKRKDFSNLNKKVLGDTYLNVQVSTTVHFDAENLKGIPYTVHFFNDKGDVISRIFNEDGILQKDINLKDINKFRIDLPKEQLNIMDLRGWAFRDMHFVRIPNYDYIDYIFSSGGIRTLQEGVSIPDTVVKYTNSSIEITNYNKEEVVYIAYAEPGWNWREFNITGASRELKFEESSVIRFEVTNPNIYITGFPSNWGFYSCYEGRAVCFYPTFESP